MMSDCTTGDSPFAVCQGHTQSPKSPRQKVCRVPHTAKGTRQTGIGKASLCRVQLLGHTAKPLPSAKGDPRQNFSGDRPDDMARIFAVCFPGLAHDKG